MNDPRDPSELELKARLDVNPSPDLQSRIRARAFAEPERRIPWFTLSAGLAAAAIVVVFAVLYLQRQPAAAVAPGPQSIVKKIGPTLAPEPVKAEEAKPRVIPTKKPIGVATAFTLIPAKSDRIEPLSLTQLELADALRPVPEASIPTVARLEPITLEPLALTVRTLGVNQ